jgi:hypothetical protein
LLDTQLTIGGAFFVTKISLEQKLKEGEGGFICFMDEWQEAIKL